MTKATTMLVAVLCAGLAGCSSPYKDKLYSGYAIEPAGKPMMTPYLDLVASLQQTGPQQPALVDKHCFVAVVPTADAQRCTAARNESISALMIGSENLCVAHRRSMYGNEATWNVVAGSFTNLFAGAASVVGAETAKSVLAALALFSNSQRSLVNETIYKQILITAVDKKIAELRDSRARAIHEALSRDINQYGMHAALRDLVGFHQSCSFMDGLQKALEEGNQPSSERKMVRLRQTLLGISSDLHTYCRADPSSAECVETKARFKATSDALKVLESSGS